MVEGLDIRDKINHGPADIRTYGIVGQGLLLMKEGVSTLSLVGLEVSEWKFSED